MHEKDSFGSVPKKISFYNTVPEEVSKPLPNHGSKKLYPNALFIFFLELNIVCKKVVKELRIIFAILCIIQFNGKITIS